MFEVGKKYIKKFGGSSAWSDPYECLYTQSEGNVGWLRLLGRVLPETQLWTSADWKEYKEPRSLSRWMNVYQTNDGFLETGILHKSKEEALRLTSESSFKKLLDTIEVKWTEKT